MVRLGTFLSTGTPPTGPDNIVTSAYLHEPNSRDKSAGPVASWPFSRVRRSRYAWPIRRGTPCVGTRAAACTYLVPRERRKRHGGVRHQDMKATNRTVRRRLSNQTHARTHTDRTRSRCYQRIILIKKKREKNRITHAHWRNVATTRGGHDDDCSTAPRRPARNKSNGKSSRSVTTPRRSAASCVHVSARFRADLIDHDDGHSFPL